MIKQKAVFALAGITTTAAMLASTARTELLTPTANTSSQRRLKMIRIFLLTWPILLILSSKISAAPCMADTLDKYIVMGFKCTVEDKLFSKFNYSSTATNAGMAMAGPPVNMIQVAPVTVPPGQPPSFNPGLAFSSAVWSVLANQSIDSVIDYAVTVLPQGAKIKDASLDLLGFRTNDGAIKDDERVVSAGLNLTLHTFWSIQNNMEQKKLHDESQFMPTTFVDVENRFRLAGGMMGTAQISSIENRFSEDPQNLAPIPEPSTVLLFSTGILGLFGYSWYRRKPSV